VWPLTHIGISVAMAELLNRAAGMARAARAAGAGGGWLAADHRPGRVSSANAGEVFSLPIAAVGSLFPDLDKLQTLATAGSLDRGVLHSLVGPVILLGIGIGRSSVGSARRQQPPGQVVSPLITSRTVQFASMWMLHLALDSMWKKPRFLFWPLMGWHLDHGHLTWLGFYLHMRTSLGRDPAQYVPELLGGFALAGVALWHCTRHSRAKVALRRTGCR
jgi:hypothetical protein